MSYKQIAKNNELIMEFMQNNELILEITRLPDWHCLMQVVEKIESIRGKRFIVTIFRTRCTIQDSQIFIANVARSTKMMATYMAVKLFIKWYNKEK